MLYKELTFITGNLTKFNEMTYLLKQYNIHLNMIKVDLVEIQSNDKEKIVKYKIDEVLKQHPNMRDMKFIVEDSALELDELNGFPGPLIKFMEERLGLDGLYNIVKDKNTNAKFCSTIGYWDGKAAHIISESSEGDIVLYDKTIHNIGIEPIFKPKDCDKSYGNFESREERYNIGPRSKVIPKLVKLFLNDQI